jgi:hypothetical protein
MVRHLLNIAGERGALVSNLFFNLADARPKLEAGRQDHNPLRPHGARGDLQAMSVRPSHKQLID